MKTVEQKYDGKVWKTKRVVTEYEFLADYDVIDQLGFKGNQYNEFLGKLGFDTTEINRLKCHVRKAIDPRFKKKDHYLDYKEKTEKEFLQKAEEKLSKGQIDEGTFYYTCNVIKTMPNRNAKMKVSDNYERIEQFVDALSYHGIIENMVKSKSEIQNYRNYTIAERERMHEEKHGRKVYGSLGRWMAYVMTGNREANQDYLSNKKPEKLLEDFVLITGEMDATVKFGKEFADRFGEPCNITTRGGYCMFLKRGGYDIDSYIRKVYEESGL